MVVENLRDLYYLESSSDDSVVAHVIDISNAITTLGELKSFVSALSVLFEEDKRRNNVIDLLNAHVAALRLQTPQGSPPPDDNTQLDYHEHKLHMFEVGFFIKPIRHVMNSWNIPNDSPTATYTLLDTIDFNVVRLL